MKKEFYQFRSVKLSLSKFEFTNPTTEITYVGPKSDDDADNDSDFEGDDEAGVGHSASTHSFPTSLPSSTPYESPSYPPWLFPFNNSFSILTYELLKKVDSTRSTQSCVVERKNSDDSSSQKIEVNTVLDQIIEPHLLFCQHQISKRMSKKTLNTKIRAIAKTLAIALATVFPDHKRIETSHTKPVISAFLCLYPEVEKVFHETHLARPKILIDTMHNRIREELKKSEREIQGNKKAVASAMRVMHAERTKQKLLQKNHLSTSLTMQPRSASVKSSAGRDEFQMESGEDHNIAELSLRSSKAKSNAERGKKLKVVVDEDLHFTKSTKKPARGKSSTGRGKEFQVESSQDLNNSKFTKKPARGKSSTGRGKEIDEDTHITKSTKKLASAKSSAGRNKDGMSDGSLPQGKRVNTSGVSNRAKKRK